MSSVMHRVADAYSRIDAFTSADILDLITQLDGELHRDGVGVGQLSGLSPFAYALDPQTEAGWLLGQLRQISAAKPTGLLAIASIEAWMWRAQKLMERVKAGEAGSGRAS